MYANRIEQKYSSEKYASTNGQKSQIIVSFHFPKLLPIEKEVLLSLCFYGFRIYSNDWKTRTHPKWFSLVNLLKYLHAQNDVFETTYYQKHVFDVHSISSKYFHKVSISFIEVRSIKNKSHWIYF